MSSRIVIAFFLALAVAGGIILYLAREGGERAAPPETPGATAAPEAPKKAATPEETPDEAPAVVDPSSTIAGLVYKSDGARAARARVRCLIGSAQVMETKTNRSGEFRLVGLQDTLVYSIEASIPGHMAERIDEVAVGSLRLKFVMRRGARLRGQVLTADVGMPLRDFTVTLTGAEERSVRVEDADGGAFTLEGLMGGKYTIVVAAAEWGPSEPRLVTINAGETVTENFLVPKKE